MKYLAINEILKVQEIVIMTLASGKLTKKEFFKWIKNKIKKIKK
jgi:hypothetical protein